MAAPVAGEWRVTAERCFMHSQKALPLANNYNRDQSPNPRHSPKFSGSLVSWSIYLVNWLVAGWFSYKAIPSSYSDVVQLFAILLTVKTRPAGTEH